MLLRRLVKDKHKRQRFAHIGAGLVILIHSYEKYESQHSSYQFFLIAGLVFLGVAFFHPTLEKKAPWIDGVFFFIEGILSIIVAVEFFHMSKKALPYTYIFLATFQFFMAVKTGLKGLRQHKPATKV